MNEIVLAGRRIGVNYKPLVIAEIVLITEANLLMP